MAHAVQVFGIVAAATQIEATIAVVDTSRAAQPARIYAVADRDGRTSDQLNSVKPLNLCETLQAVCSAGRILLTVQSIYPRIQFARQFGKALMFRFYGAIDRRRFLWASLLRLGLFLASVVGFPLLLMALAATTGCQGAGGGCGALGLVAAAAFKPLAFVLFVFSFAGVAMRRARDAGMPGWIGLLVPLLFAADQAFLVFVGAPWSFAFSAGALGAALFPSYALLGLACISILCVLPSRSESRNSGNPFGSAGLAAFGLVIFIGTYAALRVVAGFPVLLPVVLPIIPPLRHTEKLIPHAMIALVAVLMWIAWCNRDHVAAEPTQSTSRPEGAAALPLKTLLAAALLATTVAFALAMPDGISLLLGFFMQLIPVIVPTLLLYFLLLSSAFFVVARRTAMAAALFAVALLPFGHWAYAQWATSKEHDREAAEVAAIPTMQIAYVPRTIVFESTNSVGIRAAWAIPGIEHVVVKGPFGQKLIQFDRPPDRGPARERQTLTSLPSEYLLLRIGRASMFSKQHQIYAVAGGPLELRLVTTQRDDLVAVWYRAFNPRPSTLPLLAATGWFRGSNSATSNEFDARVEAFLAKALGT